MPAPGTGSESRRHPRGSRRERLRSRRGCSVRKPGRTSRRLHFAQPAPRHATAGPEAAIVAMMMLPHLVAAAAIGSVVGLIARSRRD